MQTAYFKKQAARYAEIMKLKPKVDPPKVDPPKNRPPLTYFSNLTAGEQKTAERGQNPPTIQGQVLDLNPRDKTPRETPEIENPMRGDRKASLSFSTSSARTLARLLASLEFKGALFLTLTQKPGKTPRQAKTALDTLFKAMKRDHPEASGIWRLEKQKNGSPHFHILVFGMTITQMFAWNPQAKWARSLDLDYAPQVDFQHINTNTGAFLYIVGHGTKKNQTWEGEAVGRYWGKHNKAFLPYAEEKTPDFLPGDLEFLQRYWERSEQRRVEWLSKKYGRDYEPRAWEFSGPLKLFPRPVSKLLRVWHWLQGKPENEENLET